MSGNEPLYLKPKMGIVPEVSAQTYETLAKQFRRNVRRQNICVRHEKPFYSKCLESKQFLKESFAETAVDKWHPAHIYSPKKC
jgi:hypothetical protein